MTSLSFLDRFDGVSYHFETDYIVLFLISFKRFTSLKIVPYKAFLIARIECICNGD